MAAKGKTYDWGGISLIVDEIRLSTKPGQSGSASTISSTELGYLDGLTIGTADDVLTLNATTTGGLAGTYIECLCISASQWLVWGHMMHSGSVADAFSAP